MRAKQVADGEGRFYGIRIDCPGCKLGHVLPVRWCPPEREASPHVAGKPHWDFDGNLALPTFAPSILSRCGHHADGTPEAECFICRTATAEDPSMCGICHSFVRAGRIEFLSDCTHPLAGQTVDLPELDGAA